MLELPLCKVMYTIPTSHKKVIIVGFIDDLALIEVAKDPEDAELYANENRDIDSQTKKEEQNQNLHTINLDSIAKYSNVMTQEKLNFKANRPNTSHKIGNAGTSLTK